VLVPYGMRRDVRIALTGGVVAASVGTYLAIAPSPFAALVGLASVAAVAWLWGGLVGALAGLAIGAHEGGFLGAAAAHGLGGALGERTLSLLASHSLLGLAIGSVSTLRTQVHVHRTATDRAQYDPLTNLFNRAAFERRVEGWIEGSTSEQASMFAVLFVDLDRFKIVNDTFGHATGDGVLVRIATILRDHVREGDLVARIGGDEFVIALRGLRDRETAAVVAEKLVALLAAPMDVGGRRISVSVSIGIAIFPRDGQDVHTLTTSADYAMYRVKAAGKNAYSFSTQELRQHRSRRLDLERSLRSALQDEELEVVYQPQFGLADDRLIGFEALLRWNSRELGHVPPSEFIPVAEEAGLIVPIGHWLLREVCFQIDRWRPLGYEGLKVAVNVSTLQFRHGEFLDHLEEAMRDARVPSSMLEVEITESVLIEQFELAVQTLRRLERLGIHTALDDFGTGYSSLAYLQRLPLRTLKIDRSFVSSLRTTATGQTGSAVPIIEAMTAMGLKLGKTLVAEGVESDAQARFLRGIGVHQVQGFLYGRPLTAMKVPALLHRRAAARGPAAFDLAAAGASDRIILVHD
jgi:diguanylate cyclase (GGDEF)-like protein